MPDLSESDVFNLAQGAIRSIFAGTVLTPAQDTSAMNAVAPHLQLAYQNGFSEGKLTTPTRKTFYTIGIALSLAILLFASYLAFVHHPVISFTQFATGAPSWERTISNDTKAQVQTDAVVIDAKKRLGTEWGFTAVIQYKDFLYLRGVNISDNTTVRILVYHWSGSWSYYGEEVN
jgi:hypothetical protein